MKINKYFRILPLNLAALHTNNKKLFIFNQYTMIAKKLKTEKGQAKATEITSDATSSITSSSNTFTWKWSKHDTLAIGDSGTKASSLICSFDMDGTLIAVKSGAKFPKDAHDWIILNEKVIPIIKTYYDKGYKIVIFTNQAGIEKGHTKESDIKTKIQNLGNLIGVPMQALIATHTDYYRKPTVGMWKYFTNNLNNGVEVDFKQSIYVGDAAGRPKEGTRVKDHSDIDYKFAVNIGIPFKTPEMFYYNIKEKIPVPEFNPKLIFQKDGSIFKGKLIKPEEVPSKSKEMIIFVGPPGAGKSTFYKNYLPSYVHVNNDTLKTKAKCMKVAQEAMTAGKSVVIDNTNPSKSVRQEYIKLAKDNKYPVRCFYFNITKDTAFHINQMRKVNPFRTHLSKSVPDMPIHAWFKNMEPPGKDEGFEAVEEINTIAGPFESTEEEDLFFCYIEQLYLHYIIIIGFKKKTISNSQINFIWIVVNNFLSQC